jgi:hypothetical protein
MQLGWLLAHNQMTSEEQLPSEVAHFTIILDDQPPQAACGAVVMDVSLPEQDVDTEVCDECVRISTTLFLAAKGAVEPSGELVMFSRQIIADANFADEDRITGAIIGGMTEAEAKAWVLTADAASMVLRLTDQEPSHPMEREEVCHAFHVVQGWLAGRPFLRALGEAQKEATQRD